MKAFSLVIVAIFFQSALAQQKCIDPVATGQAVTNSLQNTLIPLAIQAIVQVDKDVCDLIQSCNLCTNLNNRSFSKYFKKLLVPVLVEDSVAAAAADAGNDVKQSIGTSTQCYDSAAWDAKKNEIFTKIQGTMSLSVTNAAYNSMAEAEWLLAQLPQCNYNGFADFREKGFQILQEKLSGLGQLAAQAADKPLQLAYDNGSAA